MRPCDTQEERLIMTETAQNPENDDRKTLSYRHKEVGDVLLHLLH